MIFFHGSPKRIPETAHARCVRTAVRPTAIDVEDTGETKISPSYCGNAMDIWDLCGLKGLDVARCSPFIEVGHSGFRIAWNAPGGKMWCGAIE
jgi:hypothetical protein